MELINNDGITLDKMFIGHVLKTDKESRCCWVYIPELMMALPSDKEFSNTLPVEINGIKNSSALNISNTFKKSNCLKVRAMDARTKMPAINSLVAVMFIDDSIINGHWMHFNPNGTCEYDDSEANSKLITLSINDSSINIKENDNVNIKLPDDLETVIIDGQLTVKYKNDIESLDSIKSSLNACIKNISSMTERYKKLLKDNISKESIENTDFSSIFEGLLVKTYDKIYDTTEMYDVYDIEDAFKYKLDSLKYIANNFNEIHNILDNITEKKNVSDILINKDVLDVNSTFFNDLTSYDADNLEYYKELYTKNKKISFKWSDEDEYTESKNLGDEIAIPEKLNNKYLMGLFTDSAFTIPYSFNISNEKAICEESVDLYTCLTDVEIQANILFSDSKKKYYLAVALDFDTNSDAKPEVTLSAVYNDANVNLIKQTNAENDFIYIAEVNNKNGSEVNISLSFTQYSKTISLNETIKLTDDTLIDLDK